MDDRGSSREKCCARNGFQGFATGPVDLRTLRFVVDFFTVRSLRMERGQTSIGRRGGCARVTLQRFDPPAAQSFPLCVFVSSIQTKPCLDLFW